MTLGLLIGKRVRDVLQHMFVKYDNDFQVNKVFVKKREEKEEKYEIWAFLLYMLKLDEKRHKNVVAQVVKEQSSNPMIPSSSLGWSKCFTFWIKSACSAKHRIISPLLHIAEMHWIITLSCTCA